MLLSPLKTLLSYKVTNDHPMMADPLHHTTYTQCMWEEFAKDGMFHFVLFWYKSKMSLCKYLKRVLPTSEETGLGKAITRSANENVQKVLTSQV